MNEVFNFVMDNKVNIIAVSALVGRAYQAIRNGGGIKGILASIWLGTNTPQK